MRILIAILIGFAVGLIFTPAFAAQNDLSSVSSTEYVEGTDVRGQFQAATFEDCVAAEVSLFEQLRGQTPNEDQVDLFFDACMEMSHR